MTLGKPHTSTLRRLMARVEPHRIKVWFAVVASLLSAAAAGLWAWLLGPLLEGLLLDRGLALEFAGAVVAAAGVKALAAWLHAGLMQGVSQAVLAQLRVDLYARLLGLPPSFYETRHSGELLSRFSADVGQVDLAVGQALSSWAKDALQVLTLLGVCLLIDVRLFALAFIAVPLMVLPVARFARALKKTATRSQASLGALTTLAAEQLHNLPVVQSFRAEPQALARFDAEQGRYLKVMQRSLFIRGAFTPTLELFGVGVAGACVALGAQAVSSEPALAGRLVSFLAAALLMYQPLKALSGSFSQVAQGVGAAERLFAVLDAEPSTIRSSREQSRDGLAATRPSLDCSRDERPAFEGVRLEGLRVRYADGRLGLDGLTLDVPAGKLTALVGPSGGGKSSALDVVLGFVEPEAGTITWDGVAIDSFSKGSLRQRLAWVPQEPVLLSGTVRQTLLLGDPGASELALWTALGHAHAEGFVRALPHGLDEEVGERGGRLSGGQRQRLALARAFLRAPLLLVLDEPTSALDAESEREVQAGLDALMAGRTTLIAAHRLTTIQRADLIHVLDQGRCVESGTHAQLLARGGLYAALVCGGPR